MSFWSVLKKIGSTAYQVEHVLAPLASYIPGGQVLTLLDPIATKLQAAVITAEANNPIDGQGAIKGDAVLTNFAADMEAVNATLAAFGERITWDEDAAKQAIKLQADAYNAIAKLKASFKKEKIT